ncbi:MAG: NADAR family protein [Vicinamibacteria bacterium]|nr:NADAR family protein [Vicinamibacteria bacterium]
MNLVLPLSLVAFGFTTAQDAGAPHPGFPAHWWAPVSRAGAPDWEILPQEAGPGEVILSKRHELGLLSNFAPTPFTFRGTRYASLEGFWQMMLFPEDAKDPRSTFPGLKWAHTRAEVAQMTAFEAKAAGTLAEENMARMGITWVTFEGRRMEYRPTAPGEHYRLIVAATWEKVKQNPRVKEVLLSTGDLVLRPDHHQEPNAPAAWRYFEILTEIRDRLRTREPSSPPASAYSARSTVFGSAFAARSAGRALAATATATIAIPTAA